ncbi:recombinase family protein [uncultured Aquimarina sp.]|uniref:recombinase family protein n=1 Tax=uncultured Aquimarina sp. TaxID=575652 RepID=UPI00261CB900|nr:recombinase family protein [uncultured Aquimarina sp.]
MSAHIDLFKQFAKKSTKEQLRSDNKAVIYTRVSSKDQMEKGASLDTQDKYCKLFAMRKGLEVVEHFGGTYESAKSDEREEFQKMLSYVKRKKNISYIIVYSYDRFSRTGANGAFISDQLKKQGIITLSATQEVDASTSAGAFQQNLYYMFSQFDNELRRDKTVAGVKEKIRKGYWMGKLPFGYINLNPGRGKEQKVVLNEKGKLLQKAFYLKLNQKLTNVEICKRLADQGVKLNRKRLGEMFRNPFYCGLLVTSHLPGEVIKGKHEAVISRSDFLRLNEMINEDANFGIKHHRENESLPLKNFVKSAACKTPYTGYKKKKGELTFFYYKNNRKGSKENRSAKILHTKFIETLEQYKLPAEKYLDPMQQILLEMFAEEYENDIKKATVYKDQVLELDAKLEKLEEKLIFDEITKDQHDRLKAKIEAERKALGIRLPDEEINLSNFEKSVTLALQYSLNLPLLWKCGDLSVKKTVQQVVFPEGILYDFKNNHYRTIRLNPIYYVINSFSRNYNLKKERTKLNKSVLSGVVARTGLEPVTFGL